MATEAGKDSAEPNDACLLAVRLQPHRSMTPKNSRILLLVFAMVAIATSVPFMIAGAWPVGGFMGLDVVILYAAFRANFRAAQAYEDIVLTPLELALAKVSAKGLRQEWRFNPAWVRLLKEEHVEFGVQRLAIRSRGDEIEIAQFLGPDEKASFASGFNRALGEAKRGPRYS